MKNNIWRNSDLFYKRSLGVFGNGVTAMIIIILPILSFTAIWGAMTFFKSVFSDTNNNSINNSLIKESSIIKNIAEPQSYGVTLTQIGGYGIRNHEKIAYHLTEQGFLDPDLYIYSFFNNGGDQLNFSCKSNYEISSAISPTKNYITFDSERGTMSLNLDTDQLKNIVEYNCIKK